MSQRTQQPVTIIIPAINELSAIQDLVPDIQMQTAPNLSIIIADGGSTDGTLEYAKSNGLKISESAAGRAKQMNAASRLVDTGLLLFLHADTRLHSNTILENAISHYVLTQTHYSGILAGHFPIRFSRKPKKNRTLFWRYAEEKTDTNRPDSINGDQGLLISKADFAKLGCFDERLHFLEDQKISEKIFELGRWIVLPDHIITSARRFESEGEHRLYVLMSIIMGLFKTGFNDFFVLAPALYRQQRHTEKLYLTPFFKLIWHIKVKKLGLRKSIIAWYRVGRYIRSHSWQMFYFFDQLLRPLYKKRVYPCLWFHDHVFEKFIQNPIGNVITMVVAFLWFMGILMPVYWLCERKPLKMARAI